MSLEAELQKAFSLIRQLQGALNAIQRTSGAGSVVFTASKSSADLVVTHGLTDLTGNPVAPTAVHATAGNQGVVMATRAFTSTTFTVNGFFSEFGVSLSVPFSWTAER